MLKDEYPLTPLHADNTLVSLVTYLEFGELNPKELSMMLCIINDNVMLKG
ncbi:hypothetical protein LDVICp198 [lymphocystis disease virus-China]|uniref:Uncharacterized protein n=1 Tax=lymphocystis disease virus-China TaxID=256729 RepID=Q677R6_9VIRU|nr:hypothetical protein LDVICp198 [lymphocystis disease virus-China]AAU11041.1 hypothetical protein [lymphocystis disease virus-China]